MTLAKMALAARHYDRHFDSLPPSGLAIESLIALAIKWPAILRGPINDSRSTSVRSRFVGLPRPDGIIFPSCSIIEQHEKIELRELDNNKQRIIKTYCKKKNFRVIIMHYSLFRARFPLASFWSWCQIIGPAEGD